MRKSEDTIIVAYDGSAEADLALGWAAAESRATRLHITVVAVHDTAVVPWPPYQEPRDLDREHKAEVALKEHGIDDATVMSTPGAIVPTLLQRAEGAALLVAGSQGHGRVEQVLLGSVSQHLARHAPCPVVVVRPAESSDSGRIVVGIDGSPDSQAALHFACHRAQRTGEVVTALHGWKLRHTTPMDANGPTREEIGHQFDEQDILLGESLAGVRAAYPDVTVIRESAPIAPAELLVAASGNASLVVVGSRGRGTFAGLLLGSVSNAVLAGAHCPVAVVR